MIKNKQSARSLTAFIVTWSFLILTITGLVLYIVPQGRIAYWVHWSLAGMEKEQWGWVHMMFGGVFIVSGILHLYYNWKPFKKYFAERAKGHFQIKQEIVIATVFTIAVFVLSVFNLPPASWIIDLNEEIKAAWVTSPEFEPPFGHAEEFSLTNIAKRMQIDLNKAIAELKKNNIEFESPKESLEKIARKNQKTPMQIYELISIHKKKEVVELHNLSIEEIEEKLAGTGLGRKSFDELSVSLGFDLKKALQKLDDKGIKAEKTDSLRDVGDDNDMSPMDLLKIIVSP